MEWYHLTAKELEDACDLTNGMCVVPLGCLEKHSDHLPLGTDSMLAHKLACLAAKKEPAVVFPPQHYMMVASAAAQRGAIVFDAKLSMQILETLFDEIARNNFRKIALYNFHGGNRNIIPLLLQNHLARRKQDYELFMIPFDWVVEDVIKKFCTSSFGGHGDEWETSLMMYLFPDLVKTERIPPDDLGVSQDRLLHLHRLAIKTPVDFFADFPTHYAGQARFAKAETGEAAVASIIGRLTTIYRAIKEDKIAQELNNQFIKMSLFQNNPAQP